LHVASDEEAARLTLQRIVDLFPGHSLAELASQRQCHLKLELKGTTTPTALKLGTYEQDLGLKKRYPANMGVRSPEGPALPQ
jgi:hypothetical protein